MAEQLKNALATPSCTLTSTVTAGVSTSFTVSAATNLPASGTFRLTFAGASSDGTDDAVAIVGAISGTTCSSVTWETVGAQTAFAVGAQLGLVITAAGLAAYVDESTPTVNQQAALDAAASPSASNAFVTRGDLPAVPARVADVDSLRVTGGRPTVWETYDGSGSVVHPSVVYCDPPKSGYNWWAAVTPYPAANNKKENPSILVSEDGINWVEPDGVTNPLVPEPPSTDYQSDPNLIYHTDGRFYMFYRYYTASVGTGERIMLIDSDDGITWSAPQVVITSTTASRRPVSPSVWYDPLTDEWTMICVDIVPSPNALVRYTADSPAGPWTLQSAPTVLGSVNSGYQMWHFEAKRLISGQLVAIIATSTDDSGTSGPLHLATSEDNGATWRISARNPIQGNMFYKSSFVPITTERGLTLLGYIGRHGAWLVYRCPISIPANDILTARVGLEPWLVGDTFRRADGAVGNAETGQAWTASAGTMNIAGNAAAPSAAANTKIHIDVGTPDHFVSADLPLQGSIGVYQYLMARYNGSNTYYRLGAAPEGWAMDLQKVVSGTATTLATATVPGAFNLGLRCVGNRITAFVGDEAVIDIVDASITTGNGAGLQASQTYSKFTNFRCRRA